MSNKLFTVFVNSSDGFEDCWNPFFTLFKKYWPDNESPLFLNTEFKNYVHPGLNIKSTKVHEGVTDRKLTWSECLIKALQQVETPFVLYLQEDYFLESNVNQAKIQELANKMINEVEIKYIGLTKFGNYSPFYDYFGDKSLKIVSKNSRYRVSTQAGLWRTEALLSYLESDENGWEFEIFGTRRAKRSSDLFLTLDPVYLKENIVLDYQLTGIVKGKWLDTIPALFEREKIQIDFSKRGFYKELNVLFRKIETFRKIFYDPSKFFKKYL
jgi:hypothetical protein